MKSITWITPTFFIDVDIQIVPELSKTFKISWIIVGNKKPDIYSKMENLCNSNLQLEFHETYSKWYFPITYFKNKKFFNYVINKGGDIIYYDGAPQLFAYYAALHTLPQEKTVFATHNVKTPKGAHHEMLARYFMKQLLNHFQNFQVFSKNQRDYLKSMVSNKNVLYAPLTLKDYGHKGERTEKRINFLSFGHIRHYKRVDLLIKAAQQLYEDTDVDLKVTIAGNCPEWEKYNKLIMYNHLFDLHIGFIKDEKVPELFANADYLILPYQDLAQSGAITVSFNYNVPVIASDIPQFQEFVDEGKNGFLFKTESTMELKNVMKKALLLSKSDYQQLVETTNEYVKQNYSLASIAEKYIEYFNKF